VEHTLKTGSEATVAYVSFDVVPSHKGAAIHIESFVRALAQAQANKKTNRKVELVTVAAQATAMTRVNWPNVNHTVLPAVGKTLIDRVLCFQAHLRTWLQGRAFETIQVRSIFEGMVIAQNKEQLCRSLIFEVNGMPSIELKYRYPKVADDLELMNKLLVQEQICLETADHIVTPSPITQQYLINRGISAAKIQVIPNGINLSCLSYQPPRPIPTIQILNMLYFGTLSAWQGVELAIEALALYRREHDAQLTIVGPARGQQAEQLMKLARKLGVAEQVHILPAKPQAELTALMHQADVIIAPLKANDRNLVQGCCPMKVLEGMGSGTPMITSNLPVTLSLGENEKHFLAVRPGSAKAIKDAMLRLRTDLALRMRLSREGRSHVVSHYSWERSHQALLQLHASANAHPSLGIHVNSRIVRTVRTVE